MAPLEKFSHPPPPTPCRPRSRPCEAERAVLRRVGRASIERSFDRIHRIDRIGREVCCRGEHRERRETRRSAVRCPLSVVGCPSSPLSSHPLFECATRDHEPVALETCCFATSMRCAARRLEAPPRLVRRDASRLTATSRADGHESPPPAGHENLPAVRRSTKRLTRRSRHTRSLTWDVRRKAHAMFSNESLPLWEWRGKGSHDVLDSTAHPCTSLR